ncbi:putative equilibrative nucleoside transporter [Dioscorea sansibarensis]
MKEEKSPLLVPHPPPYAEEDGRRSSSTTGDADAAPPKDVFHFAYLVYFTLGAGFLLPWNAFITAVDYFSYLYPSVPVDRVFSVGYMISGLIPLLFIVGWGAHRLSVSTRINIGLALFTLCLLVVPVMDAVYVEGVRGQYSGYYVTVGAVAVSGVGDALVQGGVVGAAGELPERYMQAVCAGTAASGVLVSAMRIVTKAIFPQDAHGLRKSANVYFGVRYITEDVHSEVLKDWYPIILITGYNVFDLLGKSLPAVYLLENVNVAFAGSAARLLFYPLFLGCLHGPQFFRTEIPVTVLTCLLGLTNGYFTAILMILAPKSVPIQHAETTGIVIVVILVLGLAVGSVVSWFWVI